MYEIILIRKGNLVFALGAISPYDGVTNLAGGVVFGNKLYSPRNGEAYNVRTGEVEYGPGFDCLPIFKTRVKDGKVSVLIPRRIPSKVKPFQGFRDYADTRKVVVFGGSEAALACAETLRSLEFTVN